MTEADISLLREALVELYKAAWSGQLQAADAYNKLGKAVDDSIQRQHLFAEKECWDATLYRLGEAIEGLLTAQCFARRREQEGAR